MEIINDNNNPRKRGDNNRPTSVVVALLVIGLGILLLGRNTGFIDYSISRIFISWPMILVVIGLFSFAHAKWKEGMIMLGIGAFFLIPRITHGVAWVSTWWPLLIVFLGIILLMDIITPARGRKHRYSGTSKSSTNDGFVEIECSVGSQKQIMLESPFRGGRIKATMAGVVLDLRNTTIEEGETVLEVDCTLAGIELYIPSVWAVEFKQSQFFSGSEDKRLVPERETDEKRKLIIKGRITLGGIEVKC